MQWTAGDRTLALMASITLFAAAGCMVDEDLEGIGDEAELGATQGELGLGIDSPFYLGSIWDAVHRGEDVTDGVVIASPNGDGPFRLIPLSSSAASPACVDVIGGSTQNGTRVQQWECNLLPQQSWYLGRITNPATPRRVMPRHAQVPQKCLDVLNGMTGNTAPLQQWDCNGFAQQQWVFDALYFVGGGWNSWVYRVRPSHAPDKCLDVTGASMANGARLQIYSCHGGANQEFFLKNFDAAIPRL